MSEHPPKSSTEPSISDHKEVAFYASVVSAWATTSIEFDKHIITIASLGVGLIVSLLSTKGVSTALDLIIHSVAILSFILSIICTLSIFSRNKVYLEKIVLNNGPNTPDPILSILDRAVIITLSSGVLLTAIIGISTGIEAYTEAQKMTKVPLNEQQQIMNDILSGKLSLSNESFNNMAALRSAANANSSAVQPPKANPTEVNNTPSPPPNNDEGTGDSK